MVGEPCRVLVSVKPKLTTLITLIKSIFVKFKI